MNAGEGDPTATAEAVARRSYGKLVAFLAARTRDVVAGRGRAGRRVRFGAGGLAAEWLSGEPGGLADHRRPPQDRRRRAQAQPRRDCRRAQLQILGDGLDAAADAEIPDRRLALMFACAHPAIETGIRAPLILQVVLGLNAETIASAFLTSPAAMAKRLVRAKDKIRQAGIAFAVPERDELAGRLGAVLDAIYAAYAEGWTDPQGTDAARRDLTEESLFLARLVAELLPQKPEALGLAALMLHAEARRSARRTSDGEYVPLAEQDQARWDWPAIAEAETLLRRAGALGAIGRYQLEAALQSAHVYRCRTGHANWADVVALYDALMAHAGSPVVAVNRALALAEVDGAAAALEALQAVAGDSRLAEYQPYWAARAELLARTGAGDEARRAYAMAIGLARDPAVRRFLQRRLAALPG